MIGLLSAVFNISVCVGFPITVFIVLLAKSKKLNTELKIFIVGICTYLAAQILFRQPLLAILQNIDSYRILISTNRVAYVAVLAVTAACAEEVGRYIAFRFFVKNPEQQNTPLYFGLGHGGIESRCCAGWCRTNFHITGSSSIFLYSFLQLSKGKISLFDTGNHPSYSIRSSYYIA